MPRCPRSCPDLGLPAGELRAVSEMHEMKSRLWGSFISGISVFALAIWESYLGAVVFVLVLSLGDTGP